MYIISDRIVLSLLVYNSILVYFHYRSDLPASSSLRASNTKSKAPSKHGRKQGARSTSPWNLIFGRIFRRWWLALLDKSSHTLHSSLKHNINASLLPFISFLYSMHFNSLTGSPAIRTVKCCKTLTRIKNKKQLFDHHAHSIYARFRACGM